MQNVSISIFFSFNYNITKDQALNKCGGMSQALLNSEKKLSLPKCTEQKSSASLIISNNIQQNWWGKRVIQFNLRQQIHLLSEVNLLKFVKNLFVLISFLHLKAPAWVPRNLHLSLVKAAQRFPNTQTPGVCFEYLKHCIYF